MEGCFCGKLLGNGLDMQTPRFAQLTPYFKRSFAHHTVKNRMPVIITQTLDRLVRQKEEIATLYGKEGVVELKHVVGELSKLKYEIQTNKSLEYLVDNETDDIRLFNECIKRELDRNTTCTYFNTIWLLAECYMYRKMREIFELTNQLNEFDYFRQLKEESFQKALSLIVNLGNNLLNILKTSSKLNNERDLTLLLKLNLWGNKCDLSLSGGEVLASDTSLIDKISELDKFILSDATHDIWNAVNFNSIFEEIDIVFDNAGYELFTDLCLADFLISQGYARHMRLYVKTVPWFISDVTKSDFFWMLDQLAESSDVEALRELGVRWLNYINDGVWLIEEHAFWTSPCEFKYMREKSEMLYRQLARAKLVIFKGDLNYRKLFGERNWDPVTRVEEALEGFHPTRVCTLRTLKSDMICGLEDGVAELIEERCTDWLVSGEYGVIQYCSKVVHLL